MVDWTSFDDKELKIKMIIDHKEDYADDSDKNRKQNSPKEEADELWMSHNIIIGR